MTTDLILNPYVKLRLPITNERRHPMSHKMKWHNSKIEQVVLSISSLSRHHPTVSENAGGSLQAFVEAGSLYH